MAEQHNSIGGGPIFQPGAEEEAPQRSAIPKSNRNSTQAMVMDKARAHQIAANAEARNERQRAAERDASHRFTVGARRPAPPAEALVKVATTAGHIIPPDQQAADDRVSIGGKDTQLGVALDIGLVTRGPNGELQVTSKGRQWAGLPPAAAAPAAAKQDAKADDQDDKSAPLASNPTAEQAIRNAEAALEGVSPEAIAQVASSWFDSNTDANEVLAEIAGQMGISEEAASQRFMTVADGYQTEVNEFVARSGVDDPNAFADWAAILYPDQLQAAISGHIRGDLSGYTDLASQWATMRDGLQRPEALAHEYDGVHELQDETIVVYTDPATGIAWVYDEDGSNPETLKNAILRGRVARG